MEEEGEKGGRQEMEDGSERDSGVEEKEGRQGMEDGSERDSGVVGKEERGEVDMRRR